VISGVRITKDNLPGLKAAVRALIRYEVLIGVPDSTAERQPEEGESKPPSNAAIGYWMETGVPEKNIPARPFLVPGVESIKDEAVARLKAAGAAALGGEIKEIAKAQNAVGLIAQNAVRAKITEGPFAPLKPTTIAARQSRGRTGTRPLIDTGQLRNSITYVVRPKGK